jgi:hypothetical protein
MKTILPLLLIAALSQAADTAPRASYYKDGEIHITVLGQPETKAITSDHERALGFQALVVDHGRSSRVLPPLEG